MLQVSQNIKNVEDFSFFFFVLKYLHISKQWKSDDENHIMSLVHLKLIFKILKRYFMLWKKVKLNKNNLFK